MTVADVAALQHRRRSEVTGLLSPVRESTTFDPVANLDSEARLMGSVEFPSARVWRSSDCVVLGRFLLADEEVHLECAASLGIPVLHRPSGGGAVFHDLGNVNYSIYLPSSSPVGRGIEQSLRELSFPVLALLDKLGLPWSWVPPNNIYVAGRKISGSAQARHGGRLLHHGTLLVDTDLRRMCSLLKAGGRSCAAPVTNLKDWVPGIEVEEAARLLMDIMSGDTGGGRRIWRPLPAGHQSS
jgi:lipoate-protein ligase A